MDKDLEELQGEILAKKAKADESAIVPADSNSTGDEILPPVEFPSSKKEEPEDRDLVLADDPMKEAALASARAGKMVTELFEQATVHVIKTDDNVKKGVLSTAKQSIEDKAEALRNQTAKEAKASMFANHEDACKYFGYEEKTTPKSLIKLMAVWSYILNLLYICTFGFFLVSPLTFLLKKLKVVIRQTWLALIFAILIYALILLTPYLISLIPV